jgi:hypothetical protein
MKASRAAVRQAKTLEQLVEAVASFEDEMSARLDRIEAAILGLSNKGGNSALDEISASVLAKANEATTPAEPEAKPVKGGKNGAVS